MQIRDLSPLAKLTEDDQKQLVNWLQLHGPKDTIPIVAAPPPEGFGIKTHVTTLRRFYARYKAQELSEDAALASEISTAVKKDNSSFKTVTAATLEQAAFQIATSPNPKLGHFKALVRYVLKSADHEHKRELLSLMNRRLELDIKKFQFNAARSALLHLADLQEIVANQNIDDEDRIRAARKKIFGESVPD
jgi:hypothetical protein